MAISGLVLRLAEDLASAESAMSSLSCDPRLTLGERLGRNLAVVAETDDPRHDDELYHHLLATPGIISVDVTFVSIDPNSQESSPRSWSGDLNDCTNGSKGVPETERDGRGDRRHGEQDICTSDS